MQCISREKKLIKVLKIGYTKIQIIANDALNVHHPLRKRLAVTTLPVGNAECIYVGFAWTIFMVKLVKLNAMITCQQSMETLDDNSNSRISYQVSFVNLWYKSFIVATIIL